MQVLDVPEEFEKLVVILLVMRSFSNFLGASRSCARQLKCHALQAATLLTTARLLPKSELVRKGRPRTGSAVGLGLTVIAGFDTSIGTAPA